MLCIYIGLVVAVLVFASTVVAVLAVVLLVYCLWLIIGIRLNSK